MRLTSVMDQILDLARWAPSGDNTQPWRFEVLDEMKLVVHGFDTRQDCVYDLDGRASQLSLGALLETLDIAASGHGLTARAARRSDMPDDQPTFDVTLLPLARPTPNPLTSAIPLRSVQRRPLRTRPLTALERQTLESAVGPEHAILWFESLPERLRWASLLWQNAGLRLRLPEAFEVHRRVIQWDARYSPDRIPDQALGVDRMTLAMMRRAMRSWQRIDFLNTWLGGTIAPRLMMDWLPALACAAHVAIMAKQPPSSVDDHVAAGRAVQRFWLTATRLGLQHQPAITPLVFTRYLREGQPFTARQALVGQAQKMATGLEALLGGRAAAAIWLGRIGDGLPATFRSTRRPLSELLTKPS
jgi:nitroreductase